MYNPSTYEVSYSTSAKTFIIDHPLEQDKYLVHGCIEGPEVGVYYRGSGEVMNGVCTVHLPTYTSSFSDFTVHVSPVFNGVPRVLNSSPVTNGRFAVYGSGDGSFNWFVYGKRAHLNTEPDKHSIRIRGEGPYKYI
jgi:hypothetical protein